MKQQLKITDLNGKVQTITDLPAAIQQAEMFKSFYHPDFCRTVLDTRLREYWEDVHTKLLQLQSKSPGKPIGNK